MIAVALSSEPRICCVMSQPRLDVTIQAQVLALLPTYVATKARARLRDHDLGVAAEVAEDLAVMYAGES